MPPGNITTITDPACPAATTHTTRMSKNSRSEILFVLLQYLLPHHLQSRLVHWVTRRRARWFNRLLMPWFIRHYGVDMTQAEEEDWRRYANFNSLFTRALKPAARPLQAAADDQLAVPVDGTVSQLGDIHADRIFQAKGHEYSTTTLLGGDSHRARQFENGRFATIYLSPRDYHRIHMPLAGRLEKMVYVPGRLFSVNTITVRQVPGVFARNERVISYFDTAAGPMALILVGALHVGSMETVWAGTLTPPYGRYIRHWHYEDGAQAITLEKGEEMGRFNLGSTVILLFADRAVDFDAALVPGASTCMGQLLGRLTTRD